MKIFAQIIAFGNLLALLTCAGVLLLLYPVTPMGPLAAGLISALALAVFIGQRRYARFIALRPESLPSEGPFVPQPEWMSGRSRPGLLVVGNMVFAAVAISLPYFSGLSYHQFPILVNGFDPHFSLHLSMTGDLLNPHPLYYFLRGALIFLALMVPFNILFNLAGLVDQWPRPAGEASARRRLAWLVGGLILLALLLSSSSYVLDRGRALVRRAVWPQFETLSLNDGQLVKMAPPPGYIRIEPDHPALQKFFSAHLSAGGSQWQEQSPVAVYVADQRTYEKIIKNLERDYWGPNRLAGLAWVQQAHPSRVAMVDPSVDLLRARSWFVQPPPVAHGLQLSAPDYYIKGREDQYQPFGDEVSATGFHVDGQVIAGDRLLTVQSHYGLDGEIGAKQRQQYLDHSRQWLQALSGWQPPPPARPCPGRPADPGLHPRFLENFEADLLATWVYRDLQPSLVTTLAYNGQTSLVVGRKSGDIEIWDMSREDTKRIISQAHSGAVTDLSFSPDGESFFSASPGRDSIKLWDARTGALRHSLPGFTGPVIPVGRGALYLAVKDSEVHLLDSRRQDPPRPAPEARKSVEERCPYIDRPEPDKRKNEVSNLVVARPCYRLGGRVRALAADQAGRLVAVGDESGSIDLFRVVPDDQSPVLAPVQGLKAYDGRNGVSGLHFAPDSEALYSVSRDGQIDEWALPTLKKKRSFKSSVPFNSLASAQFLPGADLLVLVGGYVDRGDGIAISRGEFIRLIQLSSGQSIVRPAITDSARLEFLEPLSQVIAVQGNVVSVIELPEAFCPSGDRSQNKIGE